MSKVTEIAELVPAYEFNCEQRETVDSYTSISSLKK